MLYHVGLAAMSCFLYLDSIIVLHCTPTSMKMHLDVCICVQSLKSNNQKIHLREFVNKMVDTFVKSINFLVDVGRDIGLVTPQKNGKKPYWSYCLDLFAHNITTKYITEYLNSDIPDEEQFPTVKDLFVSYYEFYADDFANELIQNVDGKKHFNDSWIKAEIDEEENDTSNRGIKLTIMKKQSGSKSYDIELALSEIYDAAIKVHKAGDTPRHYPYAVIYGVYKCVIHSIENPPPMMIKICNELEQYVHKKENGVKQNITRVKKYAAPLLKRNKHLMDGLIKKVMDGIDEIPDESVDEISERAQEHIASLSRPGGSVMDMFSSLMPGSADDFETKMSENGISYENVKRLIDNSGSDAISPEELLASIPKVEGEVSMDSIFGK